jgi:hypothetical protein
VRAGFGWCVRPLRREQPSEAEGRRFGVSPTAREDRARRRVRISGGSKALKVEAQERCRGEIDPVGSVNAPADRRRSVVLFGEHPSAPSGSGFSSPSGDGATFFRKSRVSRGCTERKRLAEGVETPRAGSERKLATSAAWNGPGPTSVGSCAGSAPLAVRSASCGLWWLGVPRPGTGRVHRASCAEERRNAQESCRAPVVVVSASWRLRRVAGLADGFASFVWRARESASLSGGGQPPEKEGSTRVTSTG